VKEARRYFPHWHYPKHKQKGAEMRVVAISRQVGSQGERIAELVAKKMGLDLLTRDRIHELTAQ